MSKTLDRPGLCVCLCVCYLGQVYRSKVKVTRSKNVHLDVPLASESLVHYGAARKEILEYDMGCFKAYAIFLQYILLLQNYHDLQFTIKC